MKFWEILDLFNRKERYHLLRSALKDPFQLSAEVTSVWWTAHFGICCRTLLYRISRFIRYWRPIIQR